MLISQTAEYALRAVVCLATNADTPMTTRELSTITKAPLNYLSKVLQGLSRAGIVRSQRGLNGGFKIEKSVKDGLSLLEIIEAVSPMPTIDKCPLNLESHGNSLCPLHKRLNKSIEMVKKEFRETTVLDLLKENAGAIPLCEDT